MLKTILLLGAAPIAVRDCIMTPVRQHVRAAQYIVIGTAETNRDDLTLEGRGYRQFMRALGRQDSLRSCVTAGFRISEVVKGQLPCDTVIEVASGRGEAPTFLMGRRYVLFLRRNGKRFVVAPCSYSSELTADAVSKRLVRELYSAR